MENGKSKRLPHIYPFPYMIELQKDNRLDPCHFIPHFSEKCTIKLQKQHGNYRLQGFN
jgi:hypothetical protein